MTKYEGWNTLFTAIAILLSILALSKSKDANSIAHDANDIARKAFNAENESNVTFSFGDAGFDGAAQVVRARISYVRTDSSLAAEDDALAARMASSDTCLDFDVTCTIANVGQKDTSISQLSALVEMYSASDSPARRPGRAELVGAIVGVFDDDNNAMKLPFFLAAGQSEAIRIRIRWPLVGDIAHDAFVAAAKFGRPFTIMDLSQSLRPPVWEREPDPDSRRMLLQTNLRAGSEGFVLRAQSVDGAASECSAVLGL